MTGIIISCGRDPYCRTCAPDDPVIIDSIRIPVDGVPYNYQWQDIYVEGESVQLWTYHDLSRNIHVFDLDKQILVKTIHLTSGGPDGFPKIWDLFVHNQDSIFLFTNQSRKMFLIDDKAQILATWSFDLPLNIPEGYTRPDGFYYATFPQTGNAGMHFTDNLAFLYLYINRWMNTPGQSYTRKEYEVPYIARYNVSHQTIDETFGNYPEAYVSDDYSSYELISPYVVLDNHRIWAGFERSHEIHLYDENRRKQIKCVKSYYLPESLPLLRHGLESDIRRDFYNMQGSYVNLVHDPYRKKILRVVAHEQPDKDHTGVSLAKIRAKWSLMVLDYEGNCEQEIVFPKEKYDFIVILPTPDGIVISKENPHNFDEPEEYLSFAVISID